jgi:hypothetical protein
MKYFLGALVALMVVSTGVALADTTSYATTHVYVNVVSNISVQATDAYFDLGQIQTGDFYGEIPFRVDANTEQVTFWADATYLYKGNDPTNNDVAPILLNTTDGVDFVCDNANPTGGQSTNLAYTTSVNVNGFLGWTTEERQYESSQSGHFSQDSYLTVTWTQPDAEKPTGEYSGLVVLHAMVAI